MNLQQMGACRNIVEGAGHRCPLCQAPARPSTALNMLPARKTEFQSAYVMAWQQLNLEDATCLSICKQLTVPALRLAAVVLCWMTAAQHLLPEATLCEAFLAYERHHWNLCSATCGLERSSMLSLPLLKPPALPCLCCH